MIAPLQSFIDALRCELQQYGAILALLEVQDAPGSYPASGSLLTLAQQIETQSNALDAARNQRASFQKQLAWALGSPEGHSLQRILPSLPEEYRPLVSALTQEVNELLQRLKERAELSHLQLHRSMELMQRFVSGISPQVQSTPLADEPYTPGADSGPPVAAIV
jgi:hypothetical protein